ncbi:ketoacyl-synthetase C-terminal extension domain-containing protein [Saccharopolyspora spinosporotrichia]
MARRRATAPGGVSSFGISGTNAHAIIEEAPQVVEGERVEAGDVVAPWVLSASSAEGLRAQAARLAAHLREHPGQDPRDIAYSLATGRAALPHRAAFAPVDESAALRVLDGLATGNADGAAVGTSRRSSAPSSSSPGRVGSGRAWPSTCSTPPRFSQPRCASAPTRSNRIWTSR